MALANGEKIGLCVSGGGYRATLFNLGALWRLNEVGLLPKLDRVTSVSGGSIVAAQHGINWNKLEFNDKGVGVAFSDVVSLPIQVSFGSNLDVIAGFKGFLDPINLHRIIWRSITKINCITMLN